MRVLIEKAMDRGLGCREVGARKEGELRGRACVDGMCHVEGLFVVC